MEHKQSVTRAESTLWGKIWWVLGSAGSPVSGVRVRAGRRGAKHEDKFY